MHSPLNQYIQRTQDCGKSGTIVAQRLELDDTDTSAPVNNRAHTTRRIGSVSVRNSQAAGLRDANVTVRKDVIFLHRIAIFIGVKIRDNSLLGVREGRLFDKHLRAHARVHTGGWVVDVAAAVDMAGTEPNRGKTGAHLLEKVVVVSDVEFACVLCGVRVGVANERALPLHICQL